MPGMVWRPWDLFKRSISLIIWKILNGPINRPTIKEKTSLKNR
jgi:hypothetical protein